MVALAAFIFASPPSAHAHDYWLAPRAFHLERRAPLTIDLVVGDAFVVETSRPFERARTLSFRLHTRRRTIDLAPHDGAVPVLADYETRRLRGRVLVALERDWVDIELPDAKFGQYLAHEGLDQAAALRDREGHREIEHERYMRVVKALVVVGRPGPRDDLYRRVLGHPIEIVLLDDPAALDLGDRLRARVVRQGKPLGRATLTAYVRDGSGRVTSRRVRADAEGVATFPIERTGTWMIRTLHLERCTDCGDAQWESRWASFSFVIDDDASRQGRGRRS